MNTVKSRILQKYSNYKVKSLFFIGMCELAPTSSRELNCAHLSPTLVFEISCDGSIYAIET